MTIYHMIMILILKIADKLKCKTIIIQNGWRSFTMMFLVLKKQTKFNIDYICLWSEVYKKLYSKYLRGNLLLQVQSKIIFLKYVKITNL